MLPPPGRFAVIAATHNLPPAGVYIAMAYYYDHRAEIDRRPQEESAVAEKRRALQSLTMLDLLLANSTIGHHER